jgi:hypothetical protein
MGTQSDTLVRASDAREAELQMLKQRLAKSHTLEETVRQQQTIIQQLESQLKAQRT